MRLPHRNIRHCYYDISLEAMKNVGELLRLTGRNAEAVNVDDRGHIQAPPFDLIVCSHVLEHVISDKQLLMEFYASINDNGYLLLNVPINEVWDDPKHVRKYAPHLINTLLNECGFQVIASHQLDRWSAFLLTHEVKVKN